MARVVVEGALPTHPAPTALHHTGHCGARQHRPLPSHPPEPLLSAWSAKSAANCTLVQPTACSCTLPTLRSFITPCSTALWRLRSGVKAPTIPPLSRTTFHCKLGSYYKS